MVLPELYDNSFAPGAATELSASIGTTDTVLHVLGPASMALQQPGQFRVAVINSDTDELECMIVIGNANTTNWTVQRAVEGTTSLAFPAGSIVRHILTAQALVNIIAQGG